MRRFSQRNHLVTLNEINITPLLDLAFVLLIIFVITTPIIDQSLKLSLPVGGVDTATTRKDQIRTVEVNPAGGYVINRRPFSLPELEQYLAVEFARQPELGIFLRADKKEEFGNVAEALEVCRKLGIKKIDFRMSPPKR